MVGEVDLTGESHHSMEYPATKVAGHEAESIVAMQDRTCVEAQVFDTYFFKPPRKFHSRRFYRNPLVMQDKAKDIKSRCRGWFAEDSRFVHEQTQCIVLCHL